MADDQIGSVQKIATELRLAILDDFGLSAALEWQGGEFATRTGIACKFIRLDDLPDLDPELATAVFRIFQESLTNIVRHAKATRVEVSLSRLDTQLRLEVRDDGVGMEPDRLHDTRSLGVIGMRERAIALGGHVEFLGAPGTGTKVIVTIPLKRGQEEVTP